MMDWLRRPWLFALLVGLVAAGAAGLVSAHNGDPTQIHACVNQAATPRGQVIIYSAPGLPGSDPTSTCGTRGTPVDWNAPGVAGAVAYGEMHTDTTEWLPPGGQVFFVTNGPLQGVSRTDVGSGQGFQVASPGTYRVDFSHAKPTGNGPVAIQVNGVTVTGGLFDMFTTNDGAHSVMLSLAANDVVTVINAAVGGQGWGSPTPGAVTLKLQILKLS